MSSTSDAVVSGVSPLDLVFDVLKQRLPAPRFDDARAFAAEFFRRTPEEELSTRPAEAWAGLVIGFLDFARTRSGEAPLVRVYNPTLAEHGWESPHTVLQIVNDDMPFLVDSVSMALAQCDAAVGEVVNIGSNYEISIGDTVRLILELMDADVEVQQEDERLRPPQSEVFRLWCDNRKIDRLTGFRPRVDLREGLRRTIAWFTDPANLQRYKPHQYNV